MTDTCDVKGCKNTSAYIYVGKEVCEEHWDKHCDVQKKFNLKTASFKNGRINFFESDYRKAKHVKKEESAKASADLSEVTKELPDNSVYVSVEINDLKTEILRDGKKVAEYNISSNSFSLHLSVKKNMDKRWSSTNQTLLHVWAADCIPDDVDTCIINKVKEYIAMKGN